MNTLVHRLVDRRDFCVAGARSISLLALAGFAAWQERKRRRLQSDPECLRLYACMDCVEFSRCAQPEAQEFRASLNSKRTPTHNAASVPS